MGLQQFERRLERFIEGAFARAFRSGLQPVELGRRLTREMDLRRNIAPRGTLAPNEFLIALSPEDRERFAAIEYELVGELVSVARDHAHASDYVLLGPVSVTLDTDDSLKAGTMNVSGSMTGSEDNHEPGRAEHAASAHAGRQEPAPYRPAQGWAAGGEGSLVLPDGRRMPFAGGTMTVGRLPECEIVLTDPNVSRRHAEFSEERGVYTVSDLGSTNGTKVNGVRISGRQALSSGDQVTVGATVLRFDST